jgi:hypothetical protein
MPGRRCNRMFSGTCKSLTRGGTGPINDHDDEFIRMCFADLCKKSVHLSGVHLRAYHPVQLPLQGTDSSIDINKLAFIAMRSSSGSNPDEESRGLPAFVRRKTDKKGDQSSRISSPRQSFGSAIDSGCRGAMISHTGGVRSRIDLTVLFFEWASLLLNPKPGNLCSGIWQLWGHCRSIRFDV